MLITERKSRTQFLHVKYVGGLMAARKIRSDSTVKAAEKRLGIKNAIRNADGSNARSDKKIRTLRKEAAKKGKK